MKNVFARKKQNQQAKLRAYYDPTHNHWSFHHPLTPVTAW